MTNLAALDLQLNRGRATCRVIIETPKGGRAKLAYAPEAGAFELKRMLPDGMSFPLDFGFIPSTQGEDGDPLDVLVLNDEPAPVGTLMTVRLVGLIEAEQTEDRKTIRNDRVLAVAVVSHLFSKVERPSDLGAEFMTNLIQFWINYDRLRGVAFRVRAVREAPAAIEAIERSQHLAS